MDRPKIGAKSRCNSTGQHTLELNKLGHEYD
jgi:hypothetical protein